LFCVAFLEALAKMVSGLVVDSTVL